MRTQRINREKCILFSAQDIELIPLKKVLMFERGDVIFFRWLLDPPVGTGHALSLQVIKIININNICGV